MQKINGGKLSALDTRNETRKAVDAFLEHLPYALELMPHQAKALKQKYDALVKEGFTKEEALDIVKARPLFE